MKCKNVECQNEVENRSYCSLSCRSYYVNKYTRDYSKLRESSKIKSNKSEENYLLDPKKCLNCDNIIQYSLRRNKFCGSSCNAKFNNPKKTYTWGNKISKSIRKYLVDSGIRNSIDDVGKYEIHCKYCHGIFIRDRNDVKFCSILCRKSFRRISIDEFQSYRIDCNFKFNLADYPNEFDFSLIERHGWYSPSNKKNNLGGISRDHIFSVREGFEMGIDPKIISHPANCRLMIHSDNISKNRKSDITYEELLERIIDFDKKYITNETS